MWDYLMTAALGNSELLNVFDQMWFKSPLETYVFIEFSWPVHIKNKFFFYSLQVVKDLLAIVSLPSLGQHYRESNSY